MPPPLWGAAFGCSALCLPPVLVSHLTVCLRPLPGVSERPRVSPYPSTFPDRGTHGPQPQISQAAPAPLRCPSSVTLLPVQPHGCLHYPSQLFCLLPKCGLPEAQGLSGIPSGGAHAQGRACTCRRPTDRVHGPSVQFCTALLRTPVVLPASLRSLGALHSPPHSLCPLAHQLGLSPVSNMFLSFSLQRLSANKVLLVLRSP